MMSDCSHDTALLTRQVPCSASPPINLSPSDSDLDDMSKRFSRIESGKAGPEGALGRRHRQALIQRHRNGVNAAANSVHNSVMADRDNPEPEPVWLRRDTLTEHQVQFNVIDDLENKPVYPSDDEKVDDELVILPGEMYSRRCKDLRNSEQIERVRRERKQDTVANFVVETCQKEQALTTRKEMIVEWQTIATIIDRLLFWIFFIGTVVAYIVILICVPNSKPSYTDEIIPLHLLKRVS